MRADRLISLVMLLQSRGRMTAQDLADELHASVRTIYRDIDALSLAGVPVYAERGPGGGCALLEGYRTNLTGLTAAEVKALAMLTVPAPLVDLGLSEALEAALRKLSAALPAAHRSEEARTRQSIYLDPHGWTGAAEAVPFLPVIQAALWEGQKLKIACRLDFGTQARWIVAPYGLVAKADTWYLVCAREADLRAIRVASLTEAEPVETPFTRPADFDLAAFWETWCAESEKNRPVYPVRLRVAPGMVPLLHGSLGERAAEALRQAGPPDPDGWRTITLIFERLETARERLLGLGSAVEVLEPFALRLSLADFAEQTAALYREEKQAGRTV